MAKENGLTAVVEATVFRAGDVMRVNMQFIDPFTSRSLWSASYDQNVSNVLAAESELVTKIAAGVRMALSTTGAQVLSFAESQTARCPGGSTAFEILVQANKSAIVPDGGRAAAFDYALTWTSDGETQTTTETAPTTGVVTELGRGAVQILQSRCLPIVPDVGTPVFATVAISR